jgi:hypothetical protein
VADKPVLPANPSHQKSLIIQHSRATLTKVFSFAWGRGHRDAAPYDLRIARVDMRRLPVTSVTVAGKRRPAASVSGLSTGSPPAHLAPTDRLFWAWLSRFWPGWQDTLAFVQPRTVIAWQRTRFRDH